MVDPSGRGEAAQLFWEASALNSVTIGRFAADVDAFVPVEPGLDPLSTSGALHRLRPTSDRTQRMFRSRQSEREFRGGALDERRLARLLAAFAQHPDRPGRRLYPSAGGLNAVEVYPLLRRVDGALNGWATRYMPSDHALSAIAPLPDASVVDRLCGLQGADAQLVVILAVRLEEMLAKYGERGVRFALIEVGHAAQNLALRIGAESMRGYELGGTLDDDLEDLLRIGPGLARVSLGIACGR